MPEDHQAPRRDSLQADGAGSGDEDHEHSKALHRLSLKEHIAPLPELLESLTVKRKHYNERKVVSLIEAKADVHCRLEDQWDLAFPDYSHSLGATPLHFAARRGLSEVCRALIEHKADVNAKGTKGSTPMMIAAEFERHEVVKLLGAAKGSVLMRDEAGFCAVDIAYLEGKQSMIDMMVEFENEEEKHRHNAVLADIPDIGTITDIQELMRQDGLVEDGADDDEASSASGSASTTINHARFGVEEHEDSHVDSPVEKTSSQKFKRQGTKKKSLSRKMTPRKKTKEDVR